MTMFVAYNYKNQNNDVNKTDIPQLMDMICDTKSFISIF